MTEPAPGTILNAFTVDVEDYFHVTAFENVVSRADWPTLPSRVVANTQRLLELLGRHGVSATFFVLGWVAEKYPQLVRTIAESSHEIGCHSYWHRLIYQLSPEQFREDLRRARDVLQGITGQPVEAFRAPTWSITRQSLWALDILLEEGVRYDSSIFPIYHDRYGIPDAPPHPYRIARGHESLCEFPPSVLRWGRLNIPVAGGGYFRLYPLSWSCASIAMVNGRLAQPFMFYIHPWEIDPDQPRMAAPWKTRWRHYVNLASTERKLDQLLQRVRFGTMRQVLQQHACPESQPLTSAQAG